MVSVIAMIAGAIINATTFVGGSYLVRKWSGDGEEAEAEKKRHDLAIEKYDRDKEAWIEARQRVVDWASKRREGKYLASEDLTNTDNALSLYNKFHPDNRIDTRPKPRLENYYEPSSKQRTGEIVYVTAGMLGTTYVLSKWF